ncbi:MAG: flavodoxin [Erysipelotrichales bacterium]|nr:flavodoxin [Erysipelotrichales bacterium]
MKKIWTVFLTVCLVCGLGACRNNTPKTPEDNRDETEETTPDKTEDDKKESGETKTEEKVLVVVFSATGTTKKVADKIAAIEEADLYEIKAKEPYTDADLNWHDNQSRTTYEQNDKSARPAIDSETISLDGYTRIYVGFPIWWGEEPRIMDTFAEAYDFTGITVIPFCTSGSSPIGKSGQNLAQIAGSGNWLEGRRFGGNVSEADLKAWIDSLK